MKEETKYKIMRNITTVLMIVLLILMMVGCTVHKPFQTNQEKADYHLRNAVWHHPPYGDSTYIHISDTVFIPLEAIRDTFFLDKYDTVVRENERVKVRVIRHTDTFYVDAECKEDTVIIYKNIPCPPSVSVDEIEKAWYEEINWWKWLVISLLVLFLWRGISNLANGAKITS